MPELPDLEIIREVLAGKIVGLTVTAAQIGRPTVLRNLLGGALGDHLDGQRIVAVSRRGKFLLIAFDGGAHLAINPMLAGRIRCGNPLARDRKRDAFVLDLSNGDELRYNDAKDMGKVYLTADLDRVPDFPDLGPEATDPDLTRDVFRQRLQKHHGEIKWILTNQTFVAGIGNAYADEILWRAGLYPFRRRPSLSEAEIVSLYESMRSVLTEAIDILRARVGDQIDVEIRDFLSVHG
ncbi:MAG: Fpg/Nei family DNA glycosylase, partial [Anaerolineae bacterium]|nr:Fpg/Nei family DNA glycosylase [Anaerolineae bacterium]